MSDIVTRLREFHPDVDDFPGDEAADRIVALEALRDRLTDTLALVQPEYPEREWQAVNDALAAAKADKEAHR